jgi:hypothetical protein
MIPDFRAQFRPHYTVTEDAMAYAWWWAMVWPWMMVTL